MANKKEHILIGMFTGVFLEFCKITGEKESGKKIEIGDALLRLGSSGLGSFIGSILPDSFEPAKTPHHRSFCHSITVGGFVVTGTIDSFDDDFIKTNPVKQSFCRGMGVGYTSHLVMDAVTPMGLPVV